MSMIDAFIDFKRPCAAYPSRGLGTETYMAQDVQAGNDPVLLRAANG
jgi:hypothetical protein